MVLTRDFPFLPPVTEMLLAILSICSQEELDEPDSDEDKQNADDIAARRQAIKNKILAVGRMQKVFQLLRYVPSLFIITR